MSKKYRNLKQFIENHKHLNYLDTNKICFNIQEVLDCSLTQTSDYQLLVGGYMNPVFTFTLNKKTYVYRYPGKGSEQFINRISEFKAHQTAHELGLDDSLIWINEEGHKISNFISNYRYFNYDNTNDVKKVIKIMKKLHATQKLCGVRYDIHNEINKFYDLNKKYVLNIYPNLSEIKEVVTSIFNSLDYGNVELSLCHNDIYPTNILISDDDLYLIDWEFAKDTHPALDLTTFFVCSSYEEDEIDEIVKMYLEEEYQDKKSEYYHYFVVGAFYWLLWALHVEAHGGDTEGFVEKYYHYLIMFLNRIKKGDI